MNTVVPRLAAIAVALACCCVPLSAQDWIDLGQEGKTLYVSVQMVLPPRGEACALNLATRSGAQRVSMGVDGIGRYRLWLYQHAALGKVCDAGEDVVLVLRIRSRAQEADDAALVVFPAGAGIPADEPATWSLLNRAGSSAANLSSLVAEPMSAKARISQVRVGTFWRQVREGPVLDEIVSEGVPAPDLSFPHPVTNPGSALMLDLGETGTDPTGIDYSNLPRVPSVHAMISDVRDRGGTWVHQHAYLAFHGGRYWAMWSDGPGIPNRKMSREQHRNVAPGHDQPGTRVSYATSVDGVHWGSPMDLSGPPRINGFGWIARGYWVRDGELLALASHFNAPGYPGEGLSLEAFRWDTGADRWVAHGTVLDDTLNNFPPKKLPSGEWMMSRRDHQRNVSMAVGGIAAITEWQIAPLSSYAAENSKRPEEPYWYVLPDGRNLVGLFRNNAGKTLMRAFSADTGRTWSPLVSTNFPDATSKFFALRTSREYYVLVSNSNPWRRDPLTLAVSSDGIVFTHLFYLIGGRHIDYPHVVEHDGNLLIAFSGAKQTMEVLKVSLNDVDLLIANGEKE